MTRNTRINDRELRQELKAHCLSDVQPQPDLIDMIGSPDEAVLLLEKGMAAHA